MSSRTASIYITDKEVLDHIENMDESISGFFNKAAKEYINCKKDGIDDRIRYIIETEYLDKLSKDDEDDLKEKFKNIY